MRSLLLEQRANSAGWQGRHCFAVGSLLCGHRGDRTRRRRARRSGAVRRGGQDRHCQIGVSVHAVTPIWASAAIDWRLFLQEFLDDEKTADEKTAAEIRARRARSAIPDGVRHRERAPRAGHAGQGHRRVGAARAAAHPVEAVPTTAARVGTIRPPERAVPTSRPI